MTIHVPDQPPHGIQRPHGKPAFTHSCSQSPLLGGGTNLAAATPSGKSPCCRPRPSCLHARPVSPLARNPPRSKCLRHAHRLSERRGPSSREHAPVMMTRPEKMRARTRVSKGNAHAYASRGGGESLTRHRVPAHRETMRCVRGCHSVGSEARKMRFVLSSAAAVCVSTEPECVATPSSSTSSVWRLSGAGGPGRLFACPA